MHKDRLAKPHIIHRIKDIEPDPNNYLHRLFSGVKLGHKDSLKALGEIFIEKIIDKIDFSKSKNWVIANSPSNVTRITPMFYVAKYIARQIQIPHVKIIHKPLPNSCNYYLDLSPKERKEYYRSVLYYKDRSLKNKNVILVEDAYASGAVLSAATKLLLMHGAKSVHPFIFIKLKKVPVFIEKKLSLTNLKKDKNYVINNLNKKQGVITTRIMSLFLLSSPKEAERTLSLLNLEAKQSFLKTLLVYARKDGFMMKRYKLLLP